MEQIIVAGGNGSPAEDWDGALSELESRAETHSLEGLQQRRRELIDTNAKLMARYGPFGHHDDYRKNFVESQKIKARSDLSKGDAKVTESRIDAEAYGSDEYHAFLDNALAEKVEYLRVQVLIDEINEKIRSREIEIRAYAVEAGLR